MNERNLRLKRIAMFCGFYLIVLATAWVVEERFPWNILNAIMFASIFTIWKSAEIRKLAAAADGKSYFDEPFSSFSELRKIFLKDPLGSFIGFFVLPSFVVSYEIDRHMLKAEKLRVGKNLDE